MVDPLPITCGFVLTPGFTGGKKKKSLRVSLIEKCCQERGALNFLHMNEQDVFQECHFVTKWENPRLTAKKKIWQ